MLDHIKTFFPKYISGLLAFVLIANIVLFAVLMTPKEAKAIAGVGDITFDPTLFGQAVKTTAIELKHTSLLTMAAAEEKGYHVFDVKKSLWDEFKSSHGIIAEITSSLFLVMIHQILGKITNDIVAWINGGGKGKIRILQDPGKFLRDAADEAGGVLMGAILNVDPKTLCDASFLKQKLAIQFAGPYAVPTFDEKVACTFTGMADGLRKFKEDFRNGGWRSWIEYTQAPNNQIGQTLIVAEEMRKIKEERSAEAVAELEISKGFLAQKKCTVILGPRGLSDHPWVGKDVEEAFTMAQSGGYSFSNDQEFMGWLVANGGKYNCKTVTPAEQISELASTALQAPIKKMEGALTALTNKLGTGMGRVLKPYVLAIGNASLNLLLKKEKGLVSDLFAAPPKRDRKISQRPSDAVQKSTMNAGSAGQVAASANDFPSFIMKSLIDFSVFVSTAAQVMDESSELGRLPMSRLEYARIFNKDVAGDVPRGFLYSNTNTNAKVGDKLVGNLEGWLTNIDCEAAVSNTSSPSVPIDQNKPFANVTATSSVPFNIIINASSTTSIFPINVAVCGDADTDTVGTQLGATGKMLTTYPAGKILFEEAQWCGAYSQETPLDVETLEEPMPPMPGFDPMPITTNLYAYND